MPIAGAVKYEILGTNLITVDSVRSPRMYEFGTDD